MYQLLIQKKRRIVIFLKDNIRFILFTVAAFFLYLTNQFYMLGQINKLLEISNSTVHLATVLMIMVIPRLIILPLSGLLTDRYNERVIMMSGFIGLTILMTAMGMAEHLGLLTMRILIIFAALFGGISAIILPSTYSIVPKIMNDKNLPIGNATIQLISQLTIFIGPAIAGILLGIITLKYYYLLIGLMMFFSFLFIYYCKIEVVSSPEITHQIRNQISEKVVVEKGIKGYKVIFQSPILIILLLFTAVLNLGVAGPQQIGLPILINEDFDLGATELGYLLSALGFGSIAGSALIGVISKKINLLLTLSLLGILFSIIWAMLAVPDQFVMICILLIFAGVFVGSMNVIFITLLQIHSLQNILGKVMSIQLMGSVGLQPVSYFLTGIIIDRYSIQVAFMFAGCIVLFASLLLFTLYFKENRLKNSK